MLEDGERLTAGRVIVAADAWTNDLLEPLGARLPLTVTQEQVSWFTPRGDPSLFAPERFPVWIWMDEPSFYGFPTPSMAGPKVGAGRRRPRGRRRRRARSSATTSARARRTPSSRRTCRAWPAEPFRPRPACTR